MGRSISPCRDWGEGDCSVSGFNPYLLSPCSLRGQEKQSQVVFLQPAPTFNSLPHRSGFTLGEVLCSAKANQACRHQGPLEILINNSFLNNPLGIGIVNALYSWMRWVPSPTSLMQRLVTQRWRRRGRWKMMSVF